MLPSVKTLRAVFGDNAKRAREILEMSRSELLELPAAAARERECYHPPKTWDLRMHCLDALAGTHGVESFQLTDGGPYGNGAEYCEYLNAGDTYTVTLLRVRGRYRVGCWGDVAEKYLGACHE